MTIKSELIEAAGLLAGVTPPGCLDNEVYIGRVHIRVTVY